MKYLRTAFLKDTWPLQSDAVPLQGELFPIHISWEFKQFSF